MTSSLFHVHVVQPYKELVAVEFAKIAKKMYMDGCTCVVNSIKKRNLQWIFFFHKYMYLDL